MRVKRRIDITDECKRRSRERVMADLRNAGLSGSPFRDAAEVVEDWVAELRDLLIRADECCRMIPPPESDCYTNGLQPDIQRVLDSTEAIK